MLLPVLGEDDLGDLFPLLDALLLAAPARLGIGGIDLHRSCTARVSTNSPAVVKDFPLHDGGRFGRLTVVVLGHFLAHVGLLAVLVHNLHLLDCRLGRLGLCRQLEQPGGETLDSGGLDGSEDLGLQAAVVGLDGAGS